ncbi:Hsp20/alpha crystallin family protein [bacterium]|nr:Hsp20/alpha crystallin family protein [bacterium]
MFFFRKIEINSKNPSSKKRKRGRKKEKAKEEVKDKWFDIEGELVVDVYQTDSEIIVQSPIAGVKQKDLDISVEEDMLEIRGVRPEPDEQNKNKEYLLQECWWGPFSRKIILPEKIDSRKVHASIQEGILVIRIPKTKKEKAKKKKIKII